MLALVPIKSLRRSKQRLASLLGPRERAELVLAMLADVLDLLESAPGVAGIAVLTRDPIVAQRARQRGHEVRGEQPGAALNASLDAAARALGLRTDRLLIIPADVPAATSTDLAALLAAHEGGVTLAPADVDGGTNALLLEPPDVISCRFGPNSASRHRAAARAAGVPVQVVPDTGLGRDLDRVDDLAWFVARPHTTHTAELLARLDVPARLAERALRDTA